MTNDVNKTIPTLGYLGLVPFIAAVFLSFGHGTVFGLTGWDYFLTYSAIILSFMSGTLWGKVVSARDEGGTQWALIFSNAFALMAWFALLWEAPLGALVILLFGYIFLWIVERNPAVGESGYCPVTYDRMRHKLTVIVSVLHGAMLLQYIIG